MTATIEQRQRYHPKLDDAPGTIPRQRDCAGRLALIESRIDFSGKTVLDLGCSGGFFALSVARKARRVLAIDADECMIDQNRREAELSHTCCNREWFPDLAVTHDAFYGTFGALVLNCAQSRFCFVGILWVNIPAFSKK